MSATAAAAAAATPAVEKLPAPIDYTITRRDLLRLGWVHPQWAPWLLSTVAMTRGWGGIVRLMAKPAGAAIASGFAAAGFVVDRDLGAVLSAIVLVLLPLAFVKALVFRELRHRHAPKGYDVACRVESTDTALRWRRGTEEREIPWRAIKNAYDINGFVLLSVSHFPDVLLPKRAFLHKHAIKRFLETVEDRAPGRVTEYAPHPQTARSATPRTRRMIEGLSVLFILLLILGIILLEKLSP